MVYLPREDSHLLAKAVAEYLGNLDKKELLSLKVLDMGSGSGIQVENCLKYGVEKKNILCVDIDKEAVELLMDKGFRAVESDLLKDIQEKEFNLIVFNPPYLPDDENDAGLDTGGGEKGIETTIRFLRQAKKHLNKNGKIFIVASSLADLNELMRQTEKAGYKIKKISEKKLFFERIEVWEIWLEIDFKERLYRKTTMFLYGV
ncbi:MAG: HemK2/MTQ2 family protein methyltransferase [Nanoarchaeota archaeon]